MKLQTTYYNTYKAILNFTLTLKEIKQTRRILNSI